MTSVSKIVSKVLLEVASKGDRALAVYASKFDRVELFSSGLFPVPKERLKIAYEHISPSLRNALILAKKRIELFHREELKQISPSWSKKWDGILVGQKRSSLSKVGIYVPGGRTSYPSTMLMTVIPARMAGVDKIVVVTPPQNLKNELLAAAFIAGADTVFGVGGPAAIAALAYGTKTIPKVDKIFGPGNQYVLEAKRQLFGVVGIDALAGPSEIAIWADGSVSPKQCALNLLAQAEHDPKAKAVFLTQDKNLISKVKEEIPKGFLGQIYFIHEPKNESIIDKINDLAPEHLWMALKNGRDYFSRIKNAGAIFIGGKTPVALGDYAAGPSHVLPTGGAARFSSGLSVKDFFKWSSVIEVQSECDSIFKAGQTLAEVENLKFHSQSLKEF